jgi:isoleucyl-tRNA synthetase
MTERDYRDSVFLPATDFPMRGDLPINEPKILARWEKLGLFERLRTESAGKPKFILHDGPPYANGDPHIGHALNKILKDVINRAHQMAGFDAHYIPGWDCHGLPIEWQIEEQYRKKGRDKDAVPVLDFRAECRAWAAKWIGVQAAEFKRLGILGDFEQRYATMDFGSEAAIAAEIGRFVHNGALYRGLRPVMWSVVEKTALADAEIEYQDHTSHTVWVRFPIVSGPVQNAAIVIWTTTPWTLPGNRALAAGAAIEYALFRVDEVAEGSRVRVGDRLLVALALLPKFLTDTGITLHHLEHVYLGEELAGTVAAHPLRGQGYDHDAPLLFGDFVTTDAGTGFVHIAPGHGEEDFALGKAHGVEVPETVAGDGTYNPWVPLFAGIHMFKAHDPVCAALEEAGGLLARGKIVHSYPHSWRSKAPLIFRATPQWFIRMDGPEQIRQKALDAIAATHFVPDQGRNRIGAMVASRPDWCISRQRAWGVPIPVFVERASGEVLRDPAVTARIFATFQEEGADCWYSSPPSRFLGNDYDPAAYEQVMDIVDVWFESGCTHAFVLEARGLPWPADLYLEGSDQHRGWFQSSLLEAIGTRGRAPFKAVLTHGFTLDEQGRKMSKSLGNVVAPQEVTKQYGADILRLWVMNCDTTEDQRIGPEILKQTAELYRRLRNTLRWVLGSLDGFSEEERVNYADMPELERYILHRLTELELQLRRAVETHDWTGFYPALHHFCANDLSAFYFDVRKDALYCDRPDNATRKAARTVLEHLHRALCTWLAPVLAFTADEAWVARFGEDSSVHLTQLFATTAQWMNGALAARWDEIRTARKRITNAIEEQRQQGAIKSSLQAAVTVGPEESALLSPEAWAELAIVSAVAPGAQVTASVAPGEKCVRCWKILTEVGSLAAHPTLCVRCADAVDSGLVCK